MDQAKIYKIIDNTNDNIYIGSTCQSLQRRLSKHKCDYKRFLKGLFNNVTSFDILKNNDYKIELIENCNIKTKQELKTRERYYIEHNECVNKNIPGRSRKAHYEANKVQINEKAKQYYELNKIKLNENFECSCGGKYTFKNKSSHEKSQKHIKYLEPKI